MELVDDLRVLVQRLPEVESAQIVLLHVEVNDAQIVVVHGGHVLARVVRGALALRVRVQHFYRFAQVAAQELKVRFDVDHGNALKRQHNT